MNRLKNSVPLLFLSQPLCINVAVLLRCLGEKPNGQRCWYVQNIFSRTCLAIETIEQRKHVTPNLPKTHEEGIKYPINGLRHFRKKRCREKAKTGQVKTGTSVFCWLNEQRVTPYAQSCVADFGEVALQQDHP